MTEEQKAFKLAIKKWQDIVDGTGYDRGPCALCDLFIDDGCAGCPINEDTGKEDCRGTPYVAWHALTASVNVESRLANTPERLEAAKAELAYLESLHAKLYPQENA